MKEHVYQSSIFWEWTYHAADFAQMTWPFLLSIAIALLAWRNRSVWTAIALGGASLVLAGHVTHIAEPTIRVVSMGGYAVPADGVSPIAAFLSLHSLHLGLLVVVFALGMYALRSVRHA